MTNKGGRKAASSLGFHLGTARGQPNCGRGGRGFESRQSPFSKWGVGQIGQTFPFILPEVTNFVFGILIGLFVAALLVVAALVFLDGLLDQGGVLVSPLSALLSVGPPG